jgi:hypothetical protein
MKKNAKTPLVLSRETVKSLGVTSSIKTGVAGSVVTGNCSLYCQKTVVRCGPPGTSTCPM